MQLWSPSVPSVGAPEVPAWSGTLDENSMKASGFVEMAAIASASRCIIEVQRSATKCHQATITKRGLRPEEAWLEI